MMSDRAGDDGGAVVRLVAYQCAHCGCDAAQPVSAVNRARRRGAKLFCGRACFGLARRANKSRAEKASEKREYDIQYRANNRDLLKAKKHEYFVRTYDPDKAAIDRKRRMPLHAEYCRRPEYRAWKRDYDRQYRAKQDYGPFWESFLLMMDIRTECLRQMTDYEIRIAKGTFGKSQQRKRAYERSLREEPQVGPVGNVELRQGWKNGSLTGGFRGVSGSRNPSHHQHSTASFATGQAPGSGRCNHVRGNVGEAGFAARKSGAGHDEARALARDEDPQEPHR